MQIMGEKENSPFYRTDSSAIRHYAKVYKYACGVADIVASTHPDFGASGWELAEDYTQARTLPPEGEKRERKSLDPKGEDLERSMRRARAKLRRLALANDFRWFVTLTINPDRVDSFDGAAVIKKLSAWCSNMVQREGLKYVLVPERHKSGRIHFHGFFNDCVAVVDSGHVDKAGHTVFNLPQWALGFSTAIELYDDYQKAVGYVCKYVGKQGEKPAGRWYYSGGDLMEPAVEYLELSPDDLKSAYGEGVYTFDVPGKRIAIVNGVALDQVQGGGE